MEEPETLSDEDGTISGTCGDNLTWTLKNGVLTISGTGDMENYSSSWNEYRDKIQQLVIEDGVTSIGWYAFYGYDSLESVTISDSVENIGNSAFNGCSSLSTVVVPEGVRSIGGYAFSGCSGFTGSLTLPSSVDSIGYSAFNGCSSLSSVTLPDGVTSIEEHTFKDCYSLSTVEIPEGVTSIGNGVFSGCTSLSTVEIPEGITSIGDSTFENCYCLSSIEIPEGVTSIGNSAFSCCYNLSAVEIPEGVTNIGEWAFNDCYSLSAVEIPEGVTSIGEWAFKDCYSLSTVTISEGVTSIGDGVFSGCISLSVVEIPEGVTSIGHDAFKNCTSLISVTIPESVTSIGEWAFNNCSSLRSVVIPRGIENIECSTFAYCYNLRSVVIPEGVTSIGASAFEECGNLKKIELPSSIMSIGDGAFMWCHSLSSITLPEGVTSIELGAFSWCSALSTIIFQGNAPSEVKQIFYNVTADVYYPSEKTGWNDIVNSNVFGGDLTWKSYTNLPEILPESGEDSGKFGVDGNNLEWELKDGVLTISGTGAMDDYSSCLFTPWYNYRTAITAVVIEEGVENIGDSAFSGCSNLTSVTIPDGIKSIGKDAFKFCVNLTSVTLLEGLESIGDSAFYKCVSLTSITIPEGVTSIGESAFWGCSSLSSAVILKGVTSIGKSAFHECVSLNTVKILDSAMNIGDSAFSECYGLSTVEISDRVTSIGEFVFLDCANLKKIELPDSVISIGDSAFYDCVNLKKIELPDSIESIGDGAFYDCVNLTMLELPDSIESIGDSAFGDCKILSDIIFKGNAPSVGTYTFFKVTAAVYYPSWKTGWDEVKDQNYSGNLTWIAYNEGETPWEAKETLLAPTASPSSGTVKKGTTISLTSADGATIYYTLDKTIPSTSSITYTAPIGIISDTTIKAIAVKSGYQDSAVATFTYTVKEDSTGGTEAPPSGDDSSGGGSNNTPSETPPSGDNSSGGGSNNVPSETPPIKDVGDVPAEDIPEGGIPETVWVGNLKKDTSVLQETITYTGSAIKPELQVFDNSKLLEEGTDYTISYKNNKNVYENKEYGTKSPQITIKFKGDYSGTETKIVYFNIKAVDISKKENEKNDAFVAGDLIVKYTGKNQKPKPTLLWNGKKLKNGTDFEVSGSDSGSYKDAKTYKLTLTGKNNFTGTRTIQFIISKDPNQIAMSKVSIKGLKSQPWKVDGVTPEDFKVIYKKKELSEDEYTVDYGENKNIGTGTITITGMGIDSNGDGISFIGSKTVTFKITGGKLSKVKISDIEKQYTYDGKLKKPTASLTYQSTSLTEGEDYIVTYKKNRNKGTATIIFTGMNGYTGTKKKTFKITASELGKTTIVQLPEANLDGEVYVVPYEKIKGGVKPKVKVKDGERTLEKGKDYTVSYKNNKKKANSEDKKAPTIIIKGKGNYSGSKKVYFTIQ